MLIAEFNLSDSLSRIILVDGSSGKTGALVAAGNIAKALRGRAEMVLVVDRKAYLDPNDVAMFSAVERIQLCLPKRSVQAAFSYVPCLLLSAIRLRRLACRYRADIFIFNDFYFLQVALVRLLWFTGTIVTWVRMDPRRFGLVGSIWLWFTRLASNRIVAVSKYIQDLLGDKIESEVVYDPMPAVAERTDRVCRSAPTFVFVGNYIQGKGQEIALEALARVLKDCPDARLEFHGGDLGQKANQKFLIQLKERAVDLGISGAILFGHLVREPMSVLEDKRAAINLSRSESFSMTVLEACSAGLPVISTRSGGPEEILDHGETGFLIDIDDVAGCTEAMIQLCRDPKLAESMGKSARKKVSESFSESAFRKQVLKVMELE